MLRDAIIEVLRHAFDPAGGGTEISLVDMGLVRDVAVDGDWARVELVLTPGWRLPTADLVTEVQRRLRSMPELARSEVEVTEREGESL
jgi:metal-sulfur cluster biosynthetic enzyme